MTAIINRLKGTQIDETLESRMDKLSAELAAPVPAKGRLFG
ncbi:hypothetical protein [Ovoidimarina sediminis]|nr:hypothetical protein [Rhodophyticola sp. MJ-SS7]MDU8944426.1 hypothetical protein [Rhodophyticola sp. MJ-SS7]